VPELWVNSTEDWDELQFIPRVACLSLVNVDKENLPTFDPATQNWIEISGTEPPEEVTIVISQNERIVYSVGPYTEGSKNAGPEKYLCQLQPVLTNGDEFFYNYQDVEDFDNCNTLNTGGSGGNPPGVITTRSVADFPCEDSDRAQNENKDQVSFRRFVDINRWRDANEWFDGEHEIRAHITFRNTGGPTSLKKSWFGRSDDLRTCTWFHCDVDDFDGEFKDVITWLPDVQGSLMHYLWEEVDGGPEISIGIKFKPTIKILGVELSLTEVSTSIKLKNNSDELGEHLVEYCEGTTPPSEYSSDWVFFQVRQAVN
jgi:hypothetical protein